MSSIPNPNAGFQILTHPMLTSIEARVVSVSFKPAAQRGHLHTSNMYSYRVTDKDESAASSGRFPLSNTLNIEVPDILMVDLHLQS